MARLSGLGCKCGCSSAGRQQCSTSYFIDRQVGGKNLGGYDGTMQAVVIDCEQLDRNGNILWGVLAGLTVGWLLKGR